MATESPLVRRKPNPLEDPLFQQQVPPVDPAAPVDASTLLAQGEQAFPPLADPPADVDPAPFQPPPDQVAPPPEPPAAAPAPPPAPVATGPQTVKTETQQLVLSPESKAALAEGRQLSAQQATQAERLAAAQTTQGEAKAQQEHDLNRLDALNKQYAAKLAEEAALREELAQAQHREEDLKAQEQLAAAKKDEEQKFQATQKSAWADKSVGYRIVMGLLTGAAMQDASILGQDPNDNVVLQTIRGQVARENEHRMAEYRRSKEFLAEAKLGPERARQALLNKRADIAARTEANLQFTLKRGEALAASRKVDPKVLQANLAAARAESDARLLATKQELVDRNLERGKLTNRTVTSTAVPTPVTKPALVRWQGKDYNVGDEVEARKLREKAGATETLMQGLDKLGALVQEGASPLTIGTRRSQIETEIALLTGDLKESKQLGALDAGVQKLVGAIINDPTKLRNWLLKGGSKGALASIHAAKDAAGRSIDNSLAANPATGFAPRAAAAPGEVSDLSGLSAAQLKHMISVARQKKDKRLGDLLREQGRRQKS